MSEHPVPTRRLLWIQLGLPDPDGAFATSNLPAAAGYVLSWCRSRGLLGGYDCAILGHQAATVAGDPALLAEVLRHEPDVLCLSCYMWNVERSLWLARRVKEARPETLVVAGGPEIMPDSPWWGHAGLDAVVAGEGETGLPLALSRLAAGEARPVQVLAPLLEDLAGFPDPYSSGVLPVGAAGNCFLETTRGCPYQCHYCFYSKSFRTVRRHPEPQLEAFFRWAEARAEIGDVYLLDPSFNIIPGLAGHLGKLAAWNPRSIGLHTETRLEKIDAPLARAFRAAGFQSVEAGLQSVSSRVCAGVGRRLDLPAFGRGAAAMRDAGVALEVGIILGLPGDGLAGFRRTLDWLGGQSLQNEAEIFLLSLLPGTSLRERALREGWKFMPRPPYYLLSGCGWDEAALLQGIYDLEEALDRSHYVDIPPYADDPPPGPFQHRLALAPPAAGWSRALEACLDRLAQVVTLDVTVADWRADLPELTRLGALLTRAAPFGITRLVLDGPGPIPPRVAATVRESFLVPDSYWNRLNYFRDDPVGVFNCRLYQRVPARAWRSWLGRLAGGVDPVFELPPTLDEFHELCAALGERSEPYRAYLAGPAAPFSDEERQVIRRALDEYPVFERWLDA